MNSNAMDFQRFQVMRRAVSRIRLPSVMWKIIRDAGHEPIAVMFGDDGRDRWIERCFSVGSGFRVQISCLKDHVRFVIAELGVDGANDRELVEHGRLLRQMLTKMNAG